MIKTGLLVAPSKYRNWFYTTFKEEVDTGDVEMLFADSVDEVARVFAESKIDIVFLGGSSNETAYRLDILRYILTKSPTTSVHCKGQDMDPYLFVGGILQGLSA